MPKDELAWVLGISLDDRLSWAIAPVNPSRRPGSTAFPILKFPHGLIRDLPPSASLAPQKEIDIEAEILQFLKWLANVPTISPVLEVLKGIGISTIGVTDHSEGRLINIRRKNWKRHNEDYVIDFNELFEKTAKATGISGFRRKVSVRNDATAKCMAHYRFQKHLTKRETLCFINLSVGINIGLANNQGPLASTHLHPEFGHAYPALNTFDMDYNRPTPWFNGCPAHRTCFEGLVSATRIKNEWGDGTKNLPLINKKSAAWKVIPDYVSQICWNVALATAPDAIFLGGESADPHLLDLVRDKFDEKNRGSRLTSTLRYLRYDPKQIQLAPPLPMVTTIDQKEGLLGALEVARFSLIR